MATPGTARADQRDAAESFRKSLAIFEELGALAELARTCKSYSDMLRATPDFATDQSVAAQAQLLSRRADEIQTTLRAHAAAKEKERQAEEGRAVSGRPPSSP